ncbi:GDP-L-fucose synthase [Brucella pseudogrignonensis]|uniref:GDP-L-fucose synthase n=1 Tax=Brucella pseudogrignonensis TaxID=419475 RepID=A0ABU1MB02_9HYPH|nr:GDP-L-fucose synthase [Brucella pseudogrignonensis]MDR6433017.1 GDP-L-fucose synthase [Brucella pseudogrignonensis]
MISMADAMPAPVYSLSGKKIFVAGHTGMVGSAIIRRLQSEDCALITSSHRDLDLTRQSETEEFIAQHKPDVIIVAAARVGGILANSQYPADFLYDNLAIGMNIIRAAYLSNTERLLWLGSSCIYPRDAAQPLSEPALLTGPLELTNEAYAIAKIAALKYAQACSRQYGNHFMTAMPTNLYGPNDNFNPDTSHVLPALMRRIHEAKLNGSDHITLWGSGKPLREFLHVDDLADACVHLLRFNDSIEPVNIGSGEEISIRDLALTIADVVGFEGWLEYDLSKPDGTPRKLLDTSKMRALGWKPNIRLKDGIAEVYSVWANENANSVAA